MLILAGTTGAEEEATTQDAPQQGVELLFPVGTGKHAKDAKLSKEQERAASMLQKLKAIEKGGNVNAVDKLGQTALMHAAAQDNKLAICWLVAKGADASIKSKKGKTASSVAHGDMREFLTALEKEKQPLSRQEARDMYAYRGITPGKIGNGLSSGEDAILQLRGAKAEDLSKLKNKEWKMEHFQEDPMTLALLYRIGARKFSFPENLSISFSKNLSSVKTEQLQLLRALGVKTDIVDLALQMRIALQLKQKETALELLKQNSTLLQNPELLSFISDAKTLQALLDAGLDAKNEKLMEVVLNKGDGAMLRTLLKAGATLQDPDKILKEYSDQSADFLLALIDAGTKADVNTLPVRMSPCDYTRLQYKVNATLLHQAANRVNLTDVQLLLAHGADPNTPGKKVRDGQEEPYGMTPLMAAANSLDVEKKNTMHTSGSVGWVVSSLTRKNATHRTEIVRRLLDAGVDVHVKDSAGNGVIYYAVCGAFYEGAPLPRESKKAEADILLMVELLIKAGADVPKDILARDALRSDISRAGREKLALMLLDAGADPLARKKDSWNAGWTTLMINGIYGPKIAKRLLDAGVDPTVKCEETSAMSLAMEQGAVEVVKLLKEKGIAPGELRVVSPETTKFLLELGARIPKDMTDRLMDDLCLRYADVWLPAKLSEDYIDIIQILKRHGYKPELMTWTKKDHSNSRSFNTEAFRAFLKTGENPNEVDENGNSLLANFVCSTKLSSWVADVMPAFIEAGVDVDKPINQDGQTPLFYAQDAETIAQLLRAGADAHVRDSNGRTPLFPCFFSRDVDAVRLLMQHGVRINTQDNEGNTALMMAVTKGSYGVQALLDAGADPNIKNKAGKTALQMAPQIDRKKERDKIVKLLKEHGAKEEKVDPNAKDKEGRTTLMQAALDPDGLSRLKECIAQKGDVNARDNKGCTALRLLMGQDGDINSRVQELLNAKADVNLGDSNDFTPLMTAACYKDTAKRRFRVQRLINAKANVNAAAKMGNTAAMHLLLHYDDPDTLRVLLDAGAKPDHKNGEGKTMLDIASENHRSACLKLLNERKNLGSKTASKARDSEGRTALMRAALDPDGLDRLKECIAQKGDVNARDNKGCTALRLLFGQDGDINDRVQELLNAKADVNLGDSNDFTPLMTAACYKDTAKRRFRVQRLINAKANVNAAAKMGNTAAMHLLLHYDDPGTLRMLLDAGAKPDHKNGEGKTMLDIASENHRNACFKLLNERFPAASSGHPWWPIIGGVLLVLIIGCVGRRLRRKKIGAAMLV